MKMKVNIANRPAGGGLSSLSRCVSEHIALNSQSSQQTPAKCQFEGVLDKSLSQLFSKRINLRRRFSNGWLPCFLKSPGECHFGGGAERSGSPLFSNRTNLHWAFSKPWQPWFLKVPARAQAATFRQAVAQGGTF